MSLIWQASAGRPLKGEITVPGDKSVSHRAIMLGAIAEGVTRVSGFLEGEDTLATARIFQQLGVRIETPSPSERIIHGVGLHGLKASNEDLDCGNAGTAMRLLTGLLAGQNFRSKLVGDASLSKRPMKRVIEPLSLMGASLQSEPNGLPPLIINSKNTLQGIDYKTEVASAQVKSAILLAGLYAKGETTVYEPHPTRDYTEKMLAAFGWPIEFRPGHARLSGGHRLQAKDIQVPADFSSAAFFIVAATLIPGSDLLIKSVGMNPRRTGLLATLQLMGADIQKQNSHEQAGEPVADLRVKHVVLTGIEVPESIVPDMIDEFPALFVAAAFAKGETRVSGAAELRVKESDRIAVMSQALRELGAQIEETPDGAIIQGGNLHGGEADSHGDHRIAMSLAIAGQQASGVVQINDCDNVATSFPGFLELSKSVGFELHIK
ncbi:MAG TPA: 3-phosphoshikimate 1-carboxyvinyltransferase [Arenimonas sp.]|nr:3-phosphoshikimate 1-carboxyvinyltransferase [Arenimonas sp.]HPW31289.1 3-phosphoshikimate 1-carboxyvinyltransferase [Arenimonas sp.]